MVLQEKPQFVLQLLSYILEIDDEHRFHRIRQMKTHHCNDLIFLFNDLFEKSENTILIGNGEEPVYLPMDESSPFHRIVFTRDYFASALHEIAHWCLAGKERRTKIDYGYWYYPEGRSAQEQQLFEQAEVRPQALECLFSQAAGYRFIVSQDNFTAAPNYSASTFEISVVEQAQRFLEEGLPTRAAQFHQCLFDFYKIQ